MSKAQLLGWKPAGAADPGLAYVYASVASANLSSSAVCVCAVQAVLNVQLGPKHVMPVVALS